MRLPETKFIIAGLLIVGGISYLMFSGIDSSMVYYHTLGELEAQAAELSGRGVRISGHVLPGSIVRSENGHTVEFVLYEKDTGRQLPVTYTGLIPDTFKEDAEVVVEGVFQPGSPGFEANTLLAKCPSKYEGAAEEHPEDIPIQ